MTIPTISDYPMPVAASFPTNKTKWQPDAKRAVLLIHDMQRYFLRFYEADGKLMTTLIDNLAKVKAWAVQTACRSSIPPSRITSRPATARS